MTAIATHEAIIADTVAATDAFRLPATLADLAAALPGLVTRPGDANWAEAHRAWARAVDQQPAAVVEIFDVAHVVTAVRFAAANGYAVSAQPVGHGATEALNGTIVLRTRGLRDIAVDARRRVARVGAGVKWGELLAATAPHGLTGLAGSTPDTSVVGFCLGGGLSWYGRAHGLAAHSVRSFDIVDARGVRRHVTAATDPQLFWALRGGGGDFAIVIAIEIDLFPAPHVYGGRMMWPIDMALPVLRAFRDIAAAAPDELTVWSHLLRFPPLPHLPEQIRGKSFVTVDMTYLGDAEDAERLIAPLRQIPAMHVDGIGSVPIDQVGAICAEPTDPTPSRELSPTLTGLDDDTIDRLLAVVGHRAQSPLVSVQIRSLGGALARGSLSDGPAGALTEPFQLFAMGIPMSPELDAAIAGSFEALRAALGDRLSRRTVLTFVTGANPAQPYAPGAMDRLRAVKRDVDPRGVIRSNRPVG